MSNVREDGNNEEVKGDHPLPKSGFRVEPHDFGGLMPGIDPDKIGQFADDDEDMAFMARYRR